jgi:hypothetical protein
MNAQKYTLDQYGGIQQLPSPHGASGQWRLEKIKQHWTFIDPIGNAFFALGVEDINATDSNNAMGVNYRATVTAKYGDTGAPNWGPAQVQRLRSWAFNTVGPFSGPYVWAAHQESVWPGDHYNPQKLPFFNSCLRPSYYGMINSPAYVAEPIKSFVYGINTQYDRNWIPSDGEADYYDPKLYAFLDGQLQNDWQMADLNNPQNPYRSWLIGVVTDEADQTYSFNSGADFATYPQTGHNHAHGGYRAAICSPVQTVNPVKSAVYSDTLVYTKQAWQNYLQSLAKYQTSGAPDINKLNVAWGSNYTTWGSSGTAIRGINLGTGNGSTTAFSGSLPGTPASEYSVQIFVAGAPIGGDTGNGGIWGPHLSGSINYSSGSLSLTFASGYAPASGASVTASYVSNGWGTGTGLLDEDGRHTAWTGTDSIYLTNANANFVTDINGFLYQMALYYFQTGKTHTLAHFNSIVAGWKPLYFGPDVLFYWNVPSRPPVLQAAGQVLDGFIVGGYPLPQAQLDYIFQYAGEKPLMDFELYTANPDSAMWRYPGSGQVYANQDDRSVGHRQMLLGTSSPPGLVPATYTATHTGPYVGNLWWQYLDDAPEHANWGLVSLSDNAYDSFEAVYTNSSYTRTIACSIPLNNYKCGGEEKNYGNFDGRATYNNQTALQTFCQALGACK